MIGNRSVLAIVPARGGSKGVPGKNIRPLAGKPLIAWTIDEARKSHLIDRLVASSDDEGILSVARQHGCETPFVRPSELARDDTPGVLPVLHAIDALPGFDIVVLLQPTSPLRAVADIDDCLRLVAGARPSVVTVTESAKNPYWMYRLGPEDRLQPILQNQEVVIRRQDAATTYALNGAVYAVAVDWLCAGRVLVESGVTVGLRMPSERSIDIDNELDFAWAEFLIDRQVGRAL
jgi:N-acylneuraminate cytidylyltransferase